MVPIQADGKKEVVPIQADGKKHTCGSVKAVQRATPRLWSQEESGVVQ